MDRMQTSSGSARALLADLSPRQQLHAGRLPRRLSQLLVGLVLYGVSMGLMLRATLGVDPWDVFHSGLTEHVPVSFGVVVTLVGFVVLLGWIPLRQWPGLGTVANVLVIGAATDVTLWLVPAPEDVTVRLLMTLVGGVALNGLAGALYIGAQLGPGPRDGLMTGLSRRTGWSLRLVRTGMELTVVLVGFALGGAVGLGTLVYALTIGPIVQFLLPRLVVPLDVAVETPPTAKVFLRGEATAQITPSLHSRGNGQRV
jgi:uncharacterized membrane protein YczE